MSLRSLSKMAIITPNNIEEYVNQLKLVFNDFKLEIDQKYAVYEVFRVIDPAIGFKLHRYPGSNQIILEKDNVEIYNSDGEHLAPDLFASRLIGHIREYLLRRDK